MGGLQLIDYNHFEDETHIGQKWRVEALYCETIRNRAASNNLSREDREKYQQQVIENEQKYNTDKFLICSVCYQIRRQAIQEINQLIDYYNN